MKIEPLILPLKKSGHTIGRMRITALSRENQNHILPVLVFGNRIDQRFARGVGNLTAKKEDVGICILGNDVDRVRRGRVIGWRLRSKCVVFHIGKFLPNITIVRSVGFGWC